jgi:hypothetical protein
MSRYAHQLCQRPIEVQQLRLMMNALAIVAVAYVELLSELDLGDVEYGA